VPPKKRASAVRHELWTGRKWTGYKLTPLFFLEPWEVVKTNTPFPVYPATIYLSLPSKFSIKKIHLDHDPSINNWYK
jgi:hypothetical protein